MNNHKNTTDPRMLALRGMVRRMAITATAKVLWRLAGFKQADGTTEKTDVENFSGIGFFARPPSGGSAECIVINVGGALSPAIVATRDEATRAAVAGNLADDETCVHNSQAVIIIKANGTIEARSAVGAAGALATLADLDALRSAIDGAIPVANDGGAALRTAMLLWSPVGTTKLRGE